MTIDVEAEAKKISEHEAAVWWRPPPGTHTITILEEFEEKVDKNETTGETTEQIVTSIKVKEEKMMWSAGKGQSPQSLYGQLILLAQQNGGKWKNLTFDLIVKKVGVMPSGSIKRSYTIPLVAQAAVEEVK